MSKEIGTKLKNLRIYKGLTQQDVSTRLNEEISRSTISNYEIGRRTPHLSDLKKLANVFGVGLNYFGTTKDEALELLAKAQTVFKSNEISMETKENLYRSIKVDFSTIHNEVGDKRNLSGAFHRLPPATFDVILHRKKSPHSRN